MNVTTDSTGKYGVAHRENKMPKGDGRLATQLKDRRMGCNYMYTRFSVPPPAHAHMACEACVYGRGEHAEWCKLSVATETRETDCIPAGGRKGDGNCQPQAA